MLRIRVGPARRLLRKGARGSTEVSNRYESEYPAGTTRGRPGGHERRRLPTPKAPARRPPTSRQRFLAGSVRLQAGDLVAAIARAGIAKGPLAPSFEEEASPDAAERLDALPGPSAEILTVAVATLANPPRSAVAQFSVADEAVSRLALAWNATMEQIAVVAREDNGDRDFAELAGRGGRAARGRCRTGRRPRATRWRRIYRDSRPSGGSRWPIRSAGPGCNRC